MVAEHRFVGAVRVNALTTDLINRLQAEALSETNHTSYRDEGTSKVTEKKENLEADDAKHSPKILSRDRIIQCTVEQSLNVPVPEKAERLAEVPKIVSQGGIQQRTVGADL